MNDDRILDTFEAHGLSAEDFFDVLEQIPRRRPDLTDRLASSELIAVGVLVPSDWQDPGDLIERLNRTIPCTCPAILDNPRGAVYVLTWLVPREDLQGHDLSPELVLANLTFRKRAEVMAQLVREGLQRFETVIADKIQRHEMN